MNSHNDIVNALLCDSYKMVMAYAFFQNGMQDDLTAFEIFFRKCPFGGEYVIFAGLSDVMEYVRSFKFTPQQIQYIKESILPQDADPKFLQYLEQLDGSKVQIRAMLEGSLCFPKEPLIIFEGPQVLLQLIETAILNLVSFPSLIATNASRMRTIAGEQAKLVEFGVRRAQGPDGGLSASKFAYLGGFDGSSNMIAGFKFNIPISGTVAHSFITSFNNLEDVKEQNINGVSLKERALHYHSEMNLKTNLGELASFIAYAQSMPHNFLCLVDTYHTLKSGVPNFLATAFALMDAKYEPKGIRLDSGDLAELSKEVKKVFRYYGEKFNKDVKHFQVVASNDIDESALLKFNKSGHEIDVFGIGTNLVTCLKQPALGLVYKLIECKGKETMKLSEEEEKTTWPGQKNVYRLTFKSDRIVDVVSSYEYQCEHELIAINPVDKRKYHLKPTFIESMLQPIEELQSLEQCKKYVKKQFKEFDEEVLRIEKPRKHLVLMTMEYFVKFQKQIDELKIEEVIE